MNKYFLKLSSKDNFVFKVNNKFPALSSLTKWKINKTRCKRHVAHLKYQKVDKSSVPQHVLKKK